MEQNLNENIKYK